MQAAAGGFHPRAAIADKFQSGRRACNARIRLAPCRSPLGSPTEKKIFMQAATGSRIWVPMNAWHSLGAGRKCSSIAIAPAAECRQRPFASSVAVWAIPQATPSIYECAR